MTFYTYQYLLDHQAQFPYLRLAIIVFLAIMFIGLLVRYFSNKGDIKYKDLAVIVGTLIVLALAIQFNDYTNFQTTSKQSGQQVSLVEDIAKKLDVKPQKLSVNNLQEGNGDILIHSSKGNYRVIFNSDNSEYVLEKIALTKETIKVEDK
ncbi:DUF3290 family protein [Weissella bombi]|uniref:DUF3290 domain-containing protein n=1 Tax=Weissella bombi TaxID=1505725 RepID=A0A1C4B8P9_9LACO|nr:DUF3290 family protein [Weissella bombi]SCC03271.1 Protein of unknown function [Weissella bombi]